MDKAEAYINESDALVFEGTVYSRGGTAEVGSNLVLPHAEGLGGTEGLVLRVKGDNHPYTLVLDTGARRRRAAAAGSAGGRCWRGASCCCCLWWGKLEGRCWGSITTAAAGLAAAGAAVAALLGAC